MKSHKNNSDSSSSGGDSNAKGHPSAFERMDSLMKELQEALKLNTIFDKLTEELGREPSRCEWAFRAHFASEQVLENKLNYYRDCEQKFVQYMYPIVTECTKMYD